MRSWKHLFRRRITVLPAIFGGLLMLVPLLEVVAEPPVAKPFPQEEASAELFGGTVWQGLESNGVAKRWNNRIEIRIEDPEKGQVRIPRLCTSVKEITWSKGQGPEVQLQPELTHWILKWEPSASLPGNLILKCDYPPFTLSELPKVVPDSNHSITLRAGQATTTGTKLRFEPQSHKNTVGYWTQVADFATWHFVARQPGTYSVAVLQGCGKGHGGSLGTVSIEGTDGQVALDLKTLDTGHYQNFHWVDLGTVHLTTAGEYELKIQPQKIAKVAFCDIRSIQLVYQASDVQPQQQESR